LFEAGRSYFGRSNYVEYIAGDMPVIISAPHGGSLQPKEIPDRIRKDSDDDFATVTDTFTTELAVTLSETFKSYYGHSPHVVICHLKRTKVDCNRELEEAAGSNVSAGIAWRDFHRFLSVASNSVVASSGRGCYVDLHGQSHPIKRVELGYSLTGAQLEQPDTTLNQPRHSAKSSLRTLASSELPTPFSELLRGSNSIGGLLAARGFPAVPSPSMPHPGFRERTNGHSSAMNPYFNGGYNLRKYTSLHSHGPIDGLQLEANFTGVRDTAANRVRFAQALAESFDSFFKLYYRVDLRRHDGDASAQSVPAATSTKDAHK
jgi:N-formylglutamate amidohydrolase